LITPCSPVAPLSARDDEFSYPKPTMVPSLRGVMPLPVSGEKIIIIVTVSMYIQRKFSKHSAKIHIFADITCLEKFILF